MRFQLIFNNYAVKFISVGILNTVVGYSTFAFLVYFGTPNLGALLISTVLGIVFNYSSYGRFVFKSHGGMFVFMKFIAAYGTVYCFNAICLEQLTGFFNINPYLSQSMCILPSVGLSWLLLSNLVFKKK